ncbi:unnamed protein product [Arctia plantaginis]|uniref:Peroxidase n=1 Tax=Arctia plantaginis TaxID=874455 RepID=A0A8S1AZL4_ARCPL|nr:unnamed protein product [Arctia plantaginis]CAB3250761.1 unnamed protein product [Arctia plantaginis]
MLTVVRNGQEWPPQEPDSTSVCSAKSNDEPCYLAGDKRVNQNTQLTLLQVILLRNHNRIANELAHLNPHWNDETLFEEARRIHIAEMQHINYYEYLPNILGFENMKQRKLIYPGAVGYVNDYDPNEDPSIINEHATAALRYFHTLIRGFLRRISKDQELAGVVRLSDWMNKPSILESNNSFNELTRGLTMQKMSESDEYYTDELTNYLFRGNRTFGSDLRAIDIQRGRDHGLGSYIATRAACKLPVPKTFRDMRDYISEKNVDLLQHLYASLEDVDLVVAGSLERHVPGALAGPTFFCILTKQFYRTRVGDRYFYENGADPQIAFSPAQLKAIRKGANMARFLCDNTKGIDRMQRKAFELVSCENPIIPCDQLPFIDLSQWRE